MEPQQQKEPDVFLSYATENRERAFEICAHLELLGTRCWIAPRDIPAGADYGESIIRGIERSRCFVLILSAAANRSMFVKREVERAVSKGKPVFPVRVEDVPPSPALELHLASLQYMDAWHGTLKDHIARLAADLSGAAGGHNAAPVSPPQPAWSNSKLAIGAAGLVLLAIVVLAYHFHTGNATPPLSRADVTARAIPRRHARQAAATDSTAISTDCSPNNEVPWFTCRVREPSVIRVRVANGDPVVISGGSAMAAQSRESSRTSGTLIPWLGVGTQIQVQSADGQTSEWTPIRSLADLPAAVPLHSADAAAPIVAYTLKRWNQWSYLFFGPFDTQTVEYSADGRGFVRGEPAGGWRLMGGPFWLDEPMQLPPKQFQVRWQTADGVWKGPATYTIDVAAARAQSIGGRADLNKAISCKVETLRKGGGVTTCFSRGRYALGSLFKSLNWGIDPDHLVSADSYKLEDLKAVVLRTLPAKPTCTGSGAECVTALNNYTELAATDDFVLRNLGATSVADWKDAGDINGSMSFVAAPKVLTDVYFSAMPLGGTSLVTARIRVD